MGKGGSPKRQECLNGWMKQVRKSLEKYPRTSMSVKCISISGTCSAGLKSFARSLIRRRESHSRQRVDWQQDNIDSRDDCAHALEGHVILCLIEELQTIRMIPVYQPSQPRSAPHCPLQANLDPLETHWQFIETKARRRRKSEVTLTEQGERAPSIFGNGGEL